MCKKRYVRNPEVRENALFAYFTPPVVVNVKLTDYLCIKGGLLNGMGEIDACEDMEFEFNGTESDVVGENEMAAPPNESVSMELVEEFEGRRMKRECGRRCEERRCELPRITEADCASFGDNTVNLWIYSRTVEKWGNPPVEF